MESNAVISDIFIIDAAFSIRTKLEGDWTSACTI